MTKREKIMKSRILFQKYVRETNYPTVQGWNSIAKKYSLMPATAMWIYYQCDFDTLVTIAKRGSLNELLDWKRISPVQVYQEVLSGRRKKFPAGYWFDGPVKYRCRKIGRYFFDEILEFKPEDVGRLDNALFKQYQLDGMLRYCFDGKIYNLLEFLYPGKFKPWDLPRGPRNYWNKENAIMAVAELGKEINIRHENITRKMLKEHGLRSALYQYNDDILRLKEDLIKHITEAEHGTESDTLCR